MDPNQDTTQRVRNLSVSESSQDTNGDLWRNLVCELLRRAADERECQKKEAENIMAERR